jgi:hypothetical protein
LRLKKALDSTSLSQDNHLRTPVLVLISSHFFHTETDSAQRMLGTCEQLAAGLEAAGVKRANCEPEKREAEKEVETETETETAAVGNAPLRLWVGERYLGMLSSSIYVTDWSLSYDCRAL